ncbi:MAG: hypothetical protein GXO07_02165 [Crenarchaeota archaeon]|nr:hypothetical protein [Thermoproteota archaeon]
MQAIAWLGLGIGIVELAMAYFAYRLSKESNVLDWLRLFAAGVLLLGIGQLSCKFFLQGIIGIKQFIGVPFKAAGLTLVIYSILKGISYQRAKEVGIVAAAVAVAFVLMSYHHLYGDRGPAGKAIFALAHLMFLTALPFGIAYLTWKAYVESRDPSALAMTLGLGLYGAATIVNMILYNALGLAMMQSMSVALVVRLLGVATILGGMIIAVRKPA